MQPRACNWALVIGHHRTQLSIAGLSLPFSARTGAPRQLTAQPDKRRVHVASVHRLASITRHLVEPRKIPNRFGNGRYRHRRTLGKIPRALARLPIDTLSSKETFEPLE